ncbi:uncharacterized protein BDZ99DRAFT_481321 [Mytilinidion resinicola]|uniref:Uncharacterized protein n=1 Tax=Mytilinidion resinicola TaxID=574789 RepID=A0A6A6Y634_9PEZI|nr:uncharacterized protein BDZ99DRAFT_481321 [Mytilinidion resinicola]KAF2804140.1 hypothetical protein BDZ99DRAFT_481321 [Mytilinidion resinicola]
MSSSSNPTVPSNRASMKASSSKSAAAQSGKPPIPPYFPLEHTGYTSTEQGALNNATSVATKLHQLGEGVITRMQMVQVHDGKWKARWKAAFKKLGGAIGAIEHALIARIGLGDYWKPRYEDAEAPAQDMNQKLHGLLATYSQAPQQTLSAEDRAVVAKLTAEYNDAVKECERKWPKNLKKVLPEAYVQDLLGQIESPQPDLPSALVRFHESKAKSEQPGGAEE